MTQETTIEFTDRYQALGIPYPDPETVCKGSCEGTGWYPTYRPADCPRKDEAVPVEVSDDPVDTALWSAAHRTGCSVWGRIKRVVRYRLPWRCDGWHFVKCRDCGGSGKRTGDDQ